LKIKKNIVIAKMIEEEMNNPSKEKIERQLAKKISNSSSNVIINFLLPNLFKNIICNKKNVFLRIWAC